ncbi:hypothetical protein GCM10027517_36770 [Phycicoccus ginsengisoli]
MDPWESPVERAIREAQERGEFDNLPGAGKPLRGIGASDVDDPDWWVKGLVQREQLDMTGAMPPAIALRKERQTFPESLLDLRTEESVRAVLEDFNRRVRLDRLRPAVGAMPPLIAPTVDVEDMVGQWRRLRDERAEQARVERARAAAEAQGAAAAAQARSGGRVRSWVRGLLGRG